MVLTCAGAGWGADRDMGYVGPYEGNYNVDTNWMDWNTGEQGVPDDDYAYIYHGGTVTLDAPEPNTRYLGIYYDSTLQVLDGASLALTSIDGLEISNYYGYNGTINQSGGIISTPRLNMAAGGSFNGTNVYNLSGGSLLCNYTLEPNLASDKMTFGFAGGTAKFVQTGGYVSLINNTYIHIGRGVGSLGEVTLTCGSVYVGTQQFNVGCYKGQGTFTMGDQVTVDSRYKIQVGYRGTGVFNQNGGLVTQAGEQIYLGLSDADGAGMGTYNLTAGTLQLNNRRIYVGRGYYSTTGCGMGVFNMSGGVLGGAPGSAVDQLIVGQKSGQGTFNLSGGSVNVRSLIIASDSISTNEGTPAPQGVVNVSDSGIMEITSWGTVGNAGPGQLNISGGSVSAWNGFAAGGGDPNGEGVINVTGGTLVSNNELLLGPAASKGTLNISGTGTVVANNYTLVGYAYFNDMTGNGVLAMNGGSFEGNSWVYMSYGGTAGPAHSELNIANGHFRASSLLALLDCDPNVANTAQLKIGADANVAIDTLFQIYQTGARVEMEVGAGKNSLLQAAGGSVMLGDGLATLAVNSVGTYRPDQGDTFTLITSADMSGDFSGITSNIQGLLRINRDDPNAGYRPAFSGEVVGTDYVVTFQGARAGDATGDNRIDSADLATLGAAWLQLGGTVTWLDGDFNGDGQVDGTDLALLGAGWWWQGPWLAPAPADAPIPEPATLALLALGGAALIRRKSR
jgi:hypothetical protein